MGRVPPPAVYHDSKQKGMVIAESSRRPQQWDKVATKPVKKQFYSDEATSSRPQYQKTKNVGTTLSGKKVADPVIKQLAIQMSSLTNQIKQLKENAKKGLGQNSPKRKCYICGDKTHEANDCLVKKESSGTNLKTTAGNSKEENVINLEKGKSSIGEPTSKWVPKNL